MATRPEQEQEELTPEEEAERQETRRRLAAETPEEKEARALAAIRRGIEKYYECFPNAPRYDPDSDDSGS